jgi:3-oxoacyl-[acyl-carrier protein] reductase
MRTPVTIVTGASQGIGRATAIRLARDFEAIVLTARQEDELAKTASAVQFAGAEGHRTTV